MLFPSRPKARHLLSAPFFWLGILASLNLLACKTLNSDLKKKAQLFYGDESEEQIFFREHLNVPFEVPDVMDGFGYTMTSDISDDEKTINRYQDPCVPMWLYQVYTDIPQDPHQRPKLNYGPWRDEKFLDDYPGDYRLEHPRMKVSFRTLEPTGNSDFDEFSVIYEFQTKLNPTLVKNWMILWKRGILSTMGKTSRAQDALPGDDAIQEMRCETLDQTDQYAQELPSYRDHWLEGLIRLGFYFSPYIVGHSAEQSIPSFGMEAHVKRNIDIRATTFADDHLEPKISWGDLVQLASNAFYEAPAPSAPGMGNGSPAPASPEPTGPNVIYDQKTNQEYLSKDQIDKSLSKSRRDEINKTLVVKAPPQPRAPQNSQPPPRILGSSRVHALQWVFFSEPHYGSWKQKFPGLVPALVAKIQYGRGPKLIQWMQDKIQKDIGFDISTIEALPPRSVGF